MARRGWWALMPILLGFLSGCLWTEQAEPGAWMKRLAKQAIPADQAVLRVAMIEVPIGDDFINNGLWQNIDEMAIDDDRREVLKANGLRVGQLIGSPGTDLMRLLTSKQSCAAPKDFTFPTGKPTPIPVGSERVRTSYMVVNGSDLAEVELENARYCIEVIARPTREGTRLKFTPRVEHGAPRLPFQASADHRGWEIRTDKASHTYSELSWDVTLGANQYLLVGTYPGREHTLGQNAFVHSDAAAPMQRLLVIINCRPGLPTELDGEPPEAEVTPLALQAATSARGR